MAFVWTWWKIFLISLTSAIAIVVGLGFIWPVWYGLSAHSGDTISHTHVHTHLQDSAQKVSLNGLGVGFVFNKTNNQSSRVRFSANQEYLISAEIPVTTSGSGTGMKIKMEVVNAIGGQNTQANHPFISTAGSGYQNGETITISLDEVAAAFQAVISDGTCENPGFDTDLQFTIGDLLGGGTATISDDGNYWEMEVGASKFDEAWVTLEFETRKISPNDHDQMLVVMTGTQQPTLGRGPGSVTSSIYQLNNKSYITIDRRSTSLNLSAGILQLSLNSF